MIKTLIFFVICILIQSLSFTLSFSGEIYRWVDENGIVHFSDSFTNNSQSEKDGVKIIMGYEYEKPPLPSKTELEEKKLESQKIRSQKNEAVNNHIKKDKSNLLKVNGKPYKKKRRRSKDYHERDRDRNVQIGNGGYSKQKPYSLNEVPFYRRHPSTRLKVRKISSGTNKTGTNKIGPFGKMPSKGANAGGFWENAVKRS